MEARMTGNERGPVARRANSGEAAQLKRLQEELSGIEAQLAKTEGKSADLRKDLERTDGTQTTVRVDQTQLLAANRTARALANTLGFINGAGAARAGANSANVQPRARGGLYRAGWRLVGEAGPELEYQSAGGFIAHHRQLREMAAMSDRIARARPRSVLAMPKAGSRPARGGIGSVTMHIHAQPGQDPKAIARTVLRELKKASGGALHDGGDYA